MSSARVGSRRSVASEERWLGGRAGDFKTELVAEVEKFEMEFLELAFEVFGFEFAPEGFLDAVQDGEVILFVAVVIGFALNACADEAKLLMERGDVDGFFFSAALAFNELFQFLAGGKIFSLCLRLAGGSGGLFEVLSGMNGETGGIGKERLGG